MKEAVLKYKCRLCGEVIDGGITDGDFAIPVLLDIISGKVTKSIPQKLIDIHTCQNGNVGITDCIGAKIRDIPEILRYDPDNH